jgi:hypothetical protein
MPAKASSKPVLDLANFHNPTNIDNAYFPLVAGTTFIYEGTKEGVPTYEELVVTDETKTILGVTTRVVRDTGYEGGLLAELTDDWFAQDDDGNVWYFGEFSSEYDESGNVISNEGSWEAGVDGAEPGVVMMANPQIGQVYRQEYAKGVAEDKAKVLSFDESICVTYGCFDGVLETKEFSPLEPAVVEHKYYAEGIGQLKTIMVKGGSEESHLIEIISGE